jgi:aryl-alcohol dehydrogenase-like predicted oxidoreductase
VSALETAASEQNVRAIDWTLSAEELAEIDRITKG